MALFFELDHMSFSVGEDIRYALPHVIIVLIVLIIILPLFLLFLISAFGG